MVRSGLEKRIATRILPHVPAVLCLSLLRPLKYTRNRSVLVKAKLIQRTALLKHHTIVLPCSIQDW